MRLINIETFAVKNPHPGIGGSFWIFVKLTTDSGIIGYGEIYGVQYSPEVICKMAEDTFARYWEGQSPYDTEKLFRLTYSAGFSQRPDLSVGGIISGLEMACWDIVGKAVNQPIYNLLGGLVQPKLRSYTYLYPENVIARDAIEIDYAVYDDPDTAVKRAVDYAQQGFTAVKFDPIGPYSAMGGYMLSLEKMELAVTFCAKLRETLGNKVDLLFGTHGQLSTASAKRLAQKLEPYQPLWFEEPVPPDNSSAMAEISASTTIPIATGERLTSKYEFHQVLQAGVRILQPDLARSGGILEGKKIAALAEVYNAQVAPHLYCGPIAGLANIQLGACSANFLILESMQQFEGMYSELLSHPIEWRDGYVIPSSRPGLGADLNEAVAKAYPCDDVRGQKLQLEMHPEVVNGHENNLNNG